MVVIISSEVNPAAQNIVRALLRERPAWQEKLFPVKEQVIYFDYLGDWSRSAEDYLIVPSTHRSETGSPCLTTHVPGNWSSADFGGEKSTLNFAYASKLKLILQALREEAEKAGLDWQVCMEVDHHGPTLRLPLLFVEIGSTEREWTNETAAQVAARAIVRAVETEKMFPAYVGFGGGHYAPEFTKVMLESEKAVGHILPKYQIDLVDEEMAKQALEKSVEKIEGALLDWKGMNAGQRKKVMGWLENLGIPWEKA